LKKILTTTLGVLVLILISEQAFALKKGATSSSVTAYDFHLHFRDTPDLLQVFEKAEFNEQTPRGSYLNGSLPNITLNRQAGLIISESFEPYKNELVEGRRYTDLFNSINQEASQKLVIQKREGHMAVKGLCGLILGLENTVEKARLCIGLPGFVGFKLRMETSNQPYIQYFSKNSAQVMDRYLGNLNLNPERFINDFEKISQLANEKNGAILIHFQANTLGLIRTGEQFGQAVPLPPTASDEEADAFLSVVIKYPRVHYIIAHSGISSILGIHGVKRISNFFKSHSELLNNVYIETSGYHYNDGCDEILHQGRPGAECGIISSLLNTSVVKGFVDAWREFGLDHVIFGSDDSLGSYWPWVELFAIELSSSLTNEEKQMIYRTNGEALWQSMGTN
jgi:predicted TIM-barrel fold metal-dependent hydrolase